MYLKYSTVLFSHAFCGLLVLLLLVLLTGIRENSGPLSWFLTGAILGFLPSVEYIHLLLIFPSFIFLGNKALRLERDTLIKCVSYLLFGFIVPLTLLALYNHVCFDDVFAISYKYSMVEWVRTNRSFDGNFLAGLKGLLFSPQYKGIFYSSPFLFFIPLGLTGFFRREGLTALLTLAFFLVILLPVSKHLVFWGGKTEDPRYLFTVFPMLLFPLGFWLEKGVFTTENTFTRKLLPIIVFGGAVLFSAGYQLFTSLSFGRPAGAQLITKVIETPLSIFSWQEIGLKNLFPHVQVVPLVCLILSVFLFPLVLFTLRDMRQKGFHSQG
jgi:hypothetical protein